jgi:hypothetical protein
MSIAKLQTIANLHTGLGFRKSTGLDWISLKGVTS